MKSEEYIINELGKFIKKFSNVRVRYEYDKMARVHTIEVLPNEVYRLDEEYIKWEWEMFNKFIELYPCENIGFISDDALVGIENVIYTKEGLDYAPFSVAKTSVTTFDSDLILVTQTILDEVDSLTVTGNKSQGSIAEIKLPYKYYYQTGGRFSLAA